MNEIKININFSNGKTNVEQNKDLITNDYNSTKILFNFDRPDGIKVFELKDQENNLVFLDEIKNNEVILVGKADVKDDNGYIKYIDDNENIYWYDLEHETLYNSDYEEVSGISIDELTKVTKNVSLFNKAGRYIFEVSLYDGDSKLTSVSNELGVIEEQVLINDEVVINYLPIFDELMNDIEEKIAEVNNLNVTGERVSDGVEITFTDKLGNETIKKVNDGEKGDSGDDYVITPQDYNAIAGVVETDIAPTISAIENTANTAKSIAEGANQSLSYSNYSAMITVFNALDDDVYRVGQNIYIQTTNVPDLWVYSVESTSVPYQYTTDEAFVTGLETDGYVQVGYYKLSALETQKVDLTDYVPKTTTIAGVDLQDNITKLELQTALDFNNKLDKITTTGLNRVYGVSSLGDQTIFNVDDSLSNWSLARRNGSGNIRVASTPTNSNDATSKGYVDNKITSLTGSSAPTTSTEASFVGQIYLDTINNNTYQCTAITTEDNITTYTWVKIIRDTDYATTQKAGVVKLISDRGLSIDSSNGGIYPETMSYSDYSWHNVNTFVGKGTLENVITGKGLVSNTDYATSSKGGALKIDNGLGTGVSNYGVLVGIDKTYSQYNSAYNDLFISKGTLENVITGKELLSSSDVKNNVVSTDTNKPLSANMGKELNDRIQNLASIGKYLAMWDCTTGLPTTDPVTMPYTYTTGDYYVISNVDSTNYMPNGSTYSGTASSTQYSGTETLNVGDFFYYDGTVWTMLKNTGKTVYFANIAGNPTDNSNLASTLNGKVGFTDYASSGTAGVIKSNSYGFNVLSSSGNPYAEEITYNSYQSRTGTTFIGKGTLENVLGARFVTLTQVQYDALVSGGTVDSNTYYFIEEE